MSNLEFIIDQNNANTRLDQALVGLISSQSRSQIQKMIAAEMVTVNGEFKSKHYKLRENDVIKIKQTKAAKAKRAELEPKPDKTKYKIPILAQTDNYLVIEKPSGLLVHPTEKMEKNTLTEWLVKRFPEISTVGDDPKTRPGIVHRLDRSVSGLMVIARTQEMFEHLKKQFKKRTVKKTYTALVHGVVEHDVDTIDFPIARSNTNGAMAARAKNQDGKDALTAYEVVKRLSHHTLLVVKPKTGRTHQIRVHFFAIDHPIVGDKLYRSKHYSNDRIGKDATRIMLHATELTFKDLSKEKQSFVSDLPKEFDL